MSSSLMIETVTEVCSPMPHFDSIIHELNFQYGCNYELTSTKEERELQEHDTARRQIHDEQLIKRNHAEFVNLTATNLQFVDVDASRYYYSWQPACLRSPAKLERKIRSPAQRKKKIRIPTDWPIGDTWSIDDLSEFSVWSHDYDKIKGCSGQDLVDYYEKNTDCVVLSDDNNVSYLCYLEDDEEIAIRDPWTLRACLRLAPTVIHLTNPYLDKYYTNEYKILPINSSVLLVLCLMRHYFGNDHSVWYYLKPKFLRRIYLEWDWRDLADPIYAKHILHTPMFKDVFFKRFINENAFSQDVRINPEIFTQEMDAAAEETSTENSTSVTQNSEPVTDSSPEEVITIPEIEQMSSEDKFMPIQLLDRWVRLDTFRWDATGLGGLPQRFYDLPIALGATTTTLCESLVTSIWQLNRTQRVGMEVRIICPAQPMISGKMLMKFYYEAIADLDIASRYNKFSMSHGKSVGIRAGAKTAAGLQMHFNNRNACFSNQTTSYDTQGVLNLGRLVLSEMNVLRAGADVTPFINVSIEIRFTKAVFHGRIPSTLLTTPRMLTFRQEGMIGDLVNSSVAKPYLDTLDEAEAMLNAVRKTDDEDKPVEPLNKTIVIPRLAESFSAGTGIGELAQPLRLDARGKKPSILKNGNKNDIKFICRDYGLFKQVQWSTAQEAGTTLISFPVEAVSDPSVYDQVAVGDTIGYALPPVDVVSSNFAFHSGNIEYKVEVINTSFHNGALAAFIVPLVEPSDLAIGGISLNQLSSVKRHVVELGVSTSEIEIQSDFHNLNHIMGIRSSDRYSTTPRRSLGMFILKVSSPLQTNNSASPVVDINIHKRGAADFEPFELKTGILSPVFDSPLLDPLLAYWTPHSGNLDWYAGNFNEFYGGNVPFLRYGALLGEIEIWSAPRGVAQIVRNPSGPGENQRWIELVGILSGVSALAQNYRFRRVMTFRPDPAVYSDQVAAPLWEEVFFNDAWHPLVDLNAQYWTLMGEAFNAMMNAPDAATMENMLPYMLQTALETEYFGFSFTPPNNGTRMVNIGDYLSPETFRQEGDSNTSVLTASHSKTSTASTQFGMNVFGEEGGSITSIMRRPIYRGEFRYNPSINAKWPVAHVTLDTPHFFVPTDYADAVNFANRWTPQAILQLAYLWVSGSISRRIVGPRIPNTNMWANHKIYDKPNDSQFIRNNELIPVVSRPVYMQSLANEFTSLEINNHLNLNIPWKQENVRNLLCRRVPTNTDLSIQQAYDIGRMDIGFQSLVDDDDNSTYIFNVFDSFGDDCELSGYRGFPPMVFNSTLDGTPFRQEGGGMDFIFDKTGLNDKLEEQARNFAAQVELGVKSGGKSITESITANFNTLMDSIKAEYSSLSLSKLAVVLGGEGMHLIANPTKKTLLVSFFNVFLQLGFFTYDIFNSLITEIGRLFGDPTQPEQDVEDDKVKEQEGGDDTSDIIGSVLSLLATGACSYIGWNNPLIKSMDWKTKYAMAFPAAIGMAWSMKRFMNSFFPMFKWVWESVLRLKVYLCDEMEAGFINSSENMLTSWIREVKELCAIGKSFIEPIDRDRLIVAHMVGGLIESKAMRQSNRYSWFRRYIDRIKELYDRVENEGLQPYIREEPFSLWFYGDAGVGKSHIADDLTTSIIKQFGIKVPGEVRVTAGPTTKFLNRLQGQPVLHIDDFLQVTSAEYSACQIAYVFDVMTSASYNPNQAAVEKKDQLYAPKLFSICCNKACPTDVGVSDIKAFLRRRHVTIHVAGNDAGLTAEFGDEFTHLKAAANFTFGTVPEKMRQGMKHLKFNLATVDPTNLNVNPLKVIIKGEEKTYLTWEELKTVVHKEYEQHAIRMKRSYASRLHNFWESKGFEVPDFTKLIGLESEPCLTILVNKWLAEYERDSKKVAQMDRILEGAGFDHLMSPALRNVVSKYYTTDLQPVSRQQGNDNGEIYDQYLNTFAADQRLSIRTQIDLDKANIDFYDPLAPTWDDGVGTHSMPYSYKLLQVAPCEHRISGDPTRDLITLLDVDDCSTNCWYTNECRQELLCYLASFSDDKKIHARVRKTIFAIPQCLKSIFNHARDAVKFTFKKAYDGIKMCGVSVWDFVTKHWKALTAAVMGLFGMWFLFIKDNEDNDYVIKMKPSGEFVTKVGVPFNFLKDKAYNIKDYFMGNISEQQSAYNPKVRTIISKPTPMMKQQGNSETEDITRVIRDAYVMLMCEMDDKWFVIKGTKKFISHAFCYGGRQSLMIRHDFEIIQKYAVRIVALLHTRSGEPFTVELGKDELVWKPFEHYNHRNDFMREGNFGTVELPASMPARRSLIRVKNGKVVFSIFQNDKTANSYQGCLIVPPKLHEQGLITTIIEVPYRHSNVVQQTMPQMDIYTDTAMTTGTVYSNNYMYEASKAGYCLGVLLDYGSNKIVGFHYSGNGRTGCAEKITSDMIPCIGYTYVQPNLMEANESFDVINSAIWPIGHMQERHQQSEVSKIVPSVIHGVCEVKTEPAILSPKDQRSTGWSPLYEGVRKHGLPSKPFPVKWVNKARKDFSEKICTMKPVNGLINPVSIHDAIFGVPGVYNSMDFSTSLGYGWKGYGPGKNRVVNPDTKWIHPEVVSRVEAMANLFKEGIIPFVIAVDCLKDETLKKEKVIKPGSTRIISTMPFEYQILLRMVTLPFVTAHQVNNFDMEHAIGISVLGPNETEFDMLGKRLEGGRIVAGDFSNFGPGANSQVAMAAIDVIMDWYFQNGCDEEFLITCRAILEVLVGTPHLAYDKIYKTPCGIISGSGVTTVLNSMIHSLYMRIAAQGMGISLAEYNLCVDLYTYGDDGIAKVMDSLIDRFNVSKLQQFFARYGIKYTSVDKDDNVIPYTSLSETSFLKHSFILQGGVYKAGLAKDSIENQLNWVSKVGDNHTNTVCNAEMALRQAYAHGAEYYENLRSKILKRFAVNGKHVVLYTYDEMEIARSIQSGEIFITDKLYDKYMVEMPKISNLIGCY